MAFVNSCLDTLSALNIDPHDVIMGKYAAPFGASSIYGLNSHAGVVAVPSNASSCKGRVMIHPVAVLHDLYMKHIMTGDYGSLERCFTLATVDSHDNILRLMQEHGTDLFTAACKHYFRINNLSIVIHINRLLAMTQPELCQAECLLEGLTVAAMCNNPLLAGYIMENLQVYDVHEQIKPKLNAVYNTAKGHGAMAVGKKIIDCGYIPIEGDPLYSYYLSIRSGEGREDNPPHGSAAGAGAGVSEIPAQAPIVVTDENRR